MKNSSIILILGWLFLVMGIILMYIVKTELSQFIGISFNGVAMGLFFTNLLNSYRKKGTKI